METVGMVLIAALAYGLSRSVGRRGNRTAGARHPGARRPAPVCRCCNRAIAPGRGIVGSQASLADTLELCSTSRCRLRRCSRRRRRCRSGRRPLHGVCVSLSAAAVLGCSMASNLTIRKGVRIGIVGSTGSGKSTTFDVLMGLLTPTEGELLVDGQPMSGNRVRAWQRTIAHVPQSIFLADTTLAENIAFGVPREAIDLAASDRRHARRRSPNSSRAARKAMTPGSANAAIRLSGGQRQRIGIARALYKRASVLVFDEATSALDNATERSVMDAIEGLNRELTIVLIAHRLYHRAPLRHHHGARAWARGGAGHL